MKSKLRYLSSIACLPVLAFSALAQAPPPQPSKPQAGPTTDTISTKGLVGTTVKNYQDETLGTVDDIALDLKSGRIVAVVLCSGGFAGLGEMRIAVPPEALHHDVAAQVVHLDANAEELKAAPRFDAANWTESTDAAHISAINRYFGQKSAFEGTGAVATSPSSVDRKSVERLQRPDATALDKDSTEINVRDRENRTAIPVDQGNSPSDLDTTAVIRRHVMAEPNLSGNARNVTIITNDGQVTLRGPVDSAEEKRIIGEIADRTASHANDASVDNQLEVKQTTGSIE